MPTDREVLLAALDACRAMYAAYQRQPRTMTKAAKDHYIDAANAACRALRLRAESLPCCDLCNYPADPDGDNPLTSRYLYGIETYHHAGGCPTEAPTPV